MQPNKLTWENNTFWKDIKERLETSWRPFSGLPMTLEEGIWTQEYSLAGASQLALFQNRYIAVDATDRGFGICPMLLDGRYYGRIGFDIEYDHKTLSLGHWDKNEGISNAKVLYQSDSISVKGFTDDGLSFEIKTSMPVSYPFLITELEIRSLNTKSIRIKPWMLCPLEDSPVEKDDTLWLKPVHFSMNDKVLSNNNSVTADPPRKETGLLAGLGVAYEGGALHLQNELKLNSAQSAPVILCDRSFDADSIDFLALDAVSVELQDGKVSFPVIIGIAQDIGYFQKMLEHWTGLTKYEKNQQKQYWLGVSEKLNIRCPDEDISTQVRYSIKNSLFSRCGYQDDGTIFIHGRPDRGYGDCSKLHQSYQMHFAALAAGEYESVKKELLAFARLQFNNGEMAIQLKPGSGFHPYAGLYSNAHFIMAAYRYVCWTGDDDFANEILDAARRAADWLLGNRSCGLIKPCGWLDAWPPKVQAQAQISVVTYIALIELCKLFEHLGQWADNQYYYREAVMLAKNIRDVFYMDENGFFAEHLFESGEVRGGEKDDFWAHTQIWAALSGISPDTRGLEACRQRCLKNGMTVIPETGLETDYICDSTDGLEELDLGSTATWLLAVWPEVTHLYAIAEIKYGRVSEAFDAVIRQLPKNVHSKNPHASPYYYAEKYLYPSDIPWLCTWSGDPTLLQVMLEGFGGVTALLEGLTIRPNIPDQWKSKGEFSSRFIWRGFELTLTVLGSGNKVGSIELNGKKHKADTLFKPGMLIKDTLNNFVVHLV